MEIGSRPDALRLFLNRLEFRSQISVESRAALLDLSGMPQRVEVHRDFVRLGEELRHSCLVMEGMVARFAQLDDGSRQTIGLHIPGDMVDLYSLMMPRAPSALQALTPCTILKIPHGILRDLAFGAPDIASAFWRDAVADGHLLAQWLVNVGRKNARSRVAHLICELAVRFTHIGRMRNGIFPMPLTQEQIADAVGLTSVHVNRSLRTLREEGLVTIARREAAILDWRSLTAAAEFDPAYLYLPTATENVLSVRSG
jgi:CRP-like cAMP-binding protein